MASGSVLSLQRWPIKSMAGESVDELNLGAVGDRVHAVCAPINGRSRRINAEDGWLGRRLRIGEAEFDIVQGCVRCTIPTRDHDTQEKWRHGDAVSLV